MLLTFRVLAKDTHSSINFELSCTVAIVCYILTRLNDSILMMLFIVTIKEVVEVARLSMVSRVACS